MNYMYYQYPKNTYVSEDNFLFVLLLSSVTLQCANGLKNIRYQGDETKHYLYLIDYL